MTDKKLPLHELILQDMEDKVPGVLCSHADSLHIISQGNILKAAVLPKKELPAIVNKICSMAAKLSHTGDVGPTRQYLEELAADLDARLDEK